MKKSIKYLGIAATMLLTVAPIAVPVIGSSTETTAKADDVSDFKSANATNIQKWVSEVKNTVQLNENSNLLTINELGNIYIHGSDYYELGTSDLTPESEFLQIFNEKDGFFSQFNDNSNNDDLFFNNDRVGVLMTATSTDGSVSGNLSGEAVNNLLSNGKAVTFHLSLKYAEKEDTPSDPIVTDDGNVISSGGGAFAPILDSNVVLATKDVVILPATSNNDTTTQTNPDNVTQTLGTIVETSFTPLINATVYDNNGTATSVTLPKMSAWNVDRTMTLNGNKYYRVANNEWVKSNDGLEIRLINAVVTAKHQTNLYNADGDKVSNRALAANSAWRTDRYATINGEKMYRVATNEWVAVSDLT